MISSTRILDDTVPALLFPDGPQSLIHRWREVVAAVPDVRAVVDPGDGGRTSGVSPAPRKPVMMVAGMRGVMGRSP